MNTSIPPFTVGLLEAAVLVSFHAPPLSWALFGLAMVGWLLIGAIAAAGEIEE